MRTIRIFDTTLRDGQSIVIEGLDPGTVLTVTETPETAYDTSVTLNGGAPEQSNTLTVTLPAGGTTILFTNHCTLTPPVQNVTAEGTPAPDSTPRPFPVPGAPATGDPADPALWAAVCAASALGAGLAWRRRRRR